MAKVLAGVAAVAGVASKFLPPPFNLIAAGVSIAATIGAALLQKPPAALGSPVHMQIGANLPALYPVGRTFVAGSKVHDVGYGPTSGGVPNPYRSMVVVGNAAGPSHELEKFQVDFTDVSFSGDNATGYYHDYLYRSTQLGACPEAAALAGPFGAITNWGSAYKLSGKTAWLLTLKDNREGKTWSGGVPNFGHVGKWALAYDPRQDDTYPGGEGDCRALDEETYVFGEAGENPGCVGATYALGRWQNGKRVMGFGFPVTSIDWPAWVEFSNVCEANGWKVGGLLAEGFGISRWDNLKRICQAGGARPAFVGGKLTVIFPRPRVAVDTIHLRDLTARARFMAMRSFAERKNTLIGRVRLESNRWDETQMDPIDVADFVTADGEVKKEERQFQLVQDTDQASELLRYEIWDRREMGPLVMPVGPRFLSYKPGAAFALGDDLVEDLDPDGVLGLAGKLATLEGRQINPEDATVELTLLIETPEKHAAVLGTTGTAAVAPAPPTGEELDDVGFALLTREAAVLIANSATQPTQVVSAGESGGSATVTVIDHTRSYPDGFQVTVTGDVFTGLTPDTPYYLGYEDLARAGGAVTIVIVGEDDQNDIMGPAWHQLGRIRTPVAGSGITYEGGGTYPPGAPIGRELPEPL